MKKLIILAIIVVAAWCVSGPYRAVQQLTAALESENIEKVDQYVDFDAVKASMQDDFALRLGGKPKGPDFGDRMASSLAGAFVSMIVTPQAMVLVFKEQSRRDDMGLSTSLPTLFTEGRWVNPHVFMIKNKQGQPTILLTRTGQKWEVTALRFK